MKWKGFLMVFLLACGLVLGGGVSHAGAWPSDDLSFTHLDSPNDDPSQARAQLLALGNKVKAVIAARGDLNGVASLDSSGKVPIGQIPTGPGGVQAYDADLSCIAGLSTSGMVARTGTGTCAVRTLTAGTGVTISNGNGVSGNPTIGLSSNLQAYSGKTPPSGDVVGTTDTQTLSNKTALPPFKVGTAVPSVAWGSGRDGVHAGHGAVFAGRSINAGLDIVSNAYWDGSDWRRISTGGSARIGLTAASGILEYYNAGSDDAGTEANGALMFRVGADGRVTSNAPCDTGYTRAAPGFCVRNNPQSTTVPLPRDSCTTITLPTNAGAMMIVVRAMARTANAVGERQTSVTAYEGTSCGGSGSLINRTVMATAREQVAAAAGQTLGVSEGIIVLRSVPNTRIQMTDDAGNNGYAEYNILGYWDN